MHADNSDGSSGDQVTYHVMTAGDAASLIGAQQQPNVVVIEALDGVNVEGHFVAGDSGSTAAPEQAPEVGTARRALSGAGPSADELAEMSAEDRAAVTSVLP